MAKTIRLASLRPLAWPPLYPGLRFGSDGSHPPDKGSGRSWPPIPCAANTSRESSRRGPEEYPRRPAPQCRPRQRRVM